MTGPRYLDPDHLFDGLLAEYRRGVYRDLSRALTPLEQLRFLAIANRRRPWAQQPVTHERRACA